MNDDNPKMDDILAVIENEYPNEGEKISIVAFANWHNILNHSALENLNEKQVLLVCSVILQLASDNFNAKNNELNNLTNKIKKISFEESLNFLREKDEDKDS